jgi:hemolysin activation/secretion protein
MGAAYQYSNLFNLDHSLAVQYQTSPGHLNDVQLFGALYHIPIYSLGDSLDLTMALSSVASGTVQLGGGLGLGVSGEGTIYQARYNQNFDKRGDYEQKLVYGFDYRMYRPSICPTGTNAACTDADAFMKPLSLTYTGQWKPVGQQLSVFAGAESNLPGGRNGSDNYYEENFALDADFTIFRYGADYAKSLPGDWQVHAAFDAQYASMKLINYVQYGLGGVNSVRGFHERELVGDKGVRGTIEVYTPDYGARFGENVNLRALAFFDFGRVMNNSPIGSAEDPQGIGSVGLGLRLGLNKALSVRADFASVVDGVGDQLTYSGKTVTGDLFTSVAIGYLF